VTGKLFLFRLLPPRADFAQTLTPAEQDAMQQHQTYWRQLMAQGRVMVYGPVADPEGVWGMGVIRADSHEDALALGRKDPAITTGVCAFDVMEIMGARTG
jgi:uncharacterized protein YciI